MFISPIPLIRKKLIIKKLLKKSAISKETAISFEDANIINPNGFKNVTKRLVKQGILKTVGNDCYYLDVTITVKKI